MTSLKVLLPVDGSEPSLAAVRHALRWWGAAPAPVSYVLVNVQEPASLYEVVVTHDAERLASLKREAGADLLRGAEALLEAAGAEYEIEIAGGVPEHMILELAETYGCDAIVMGALGQDHEPVVPDAGGLGAVAQAVLAHSPLPVTIVRSAPPAVAGEGAPEGEAA